MERLYLALADNTLQHDTLLANLEHTEEAFREQIFLKDLLNFQTVETRQLCATVALFEIFMPKAVLTAIFEPALLEPCLAAALAVGLIETYQERYFVSRLLLPLVVDELDAEQRPTIYAKAAECLSALWWDSDYKINDEEIRELIRIARAGERKDIFVKPAAAFAKRLYAVSSYNEAHALYEELLPIQRELKDKKSEGATLNNISQIYKVRGDYDTALHYLSDSLKIMQDIGDKSGECATLFNIGHIHWQANERQQAKQKWIQVYQIAKKINLAQVLAALESLAKQLGGEGLDYWEQLSAKDSDAKPTLPSGKAKNYD